MSPGTELGLGFPKAMLLGLLTGVWASSGPCETPWVYTAQQHCYQIWKDDAFKGTYQQMVDHCAAHGAGPVCVDTASENVFIADELRDDSYSGLKYWLSPRLVGTAWRCLNYGSDISYWNWQSGGAVDLAKKCSFLINKKATWEQASCTTDMHFMCEMPMGDGMTSAAPPTEATTTAAPPGASNFLPPAPMVSPYFRKTPPSQTSPSDSDRSSRRRRMFHCAGQCARDPGCRSYSVDADVCVTSLTDGLAYVRRG